MNTDKIYVEAIANEYSVKTSSKVIALQKLDRWVKRPAKIIAITIGSISLLLNSIGILFFVDLFCFDNIICKLLGIVFYVIGLVGMSFSYFVYEKIFEYRKKENAFDVIELAKDVIKRSIQ